MTATAPDYTYVREDPPSSPKPAAVKSAIPENLLLAMSEPGSWARIATYSAKTTSSTVASDLRRGVRKLPDGTTPDHWEFVSGRIKKYDVAGKELPKADDDEYGVWARYLG